MDYYLTQEELGERIGVQKSQISRMERGYSISIPTMSRVFKALGIATATLDLGIGGKIALCVSSWHVFSVRFPVLVSFLHRPLRTGLKWKPTTPNLLSL